jgi:DNA polymerase-3 subunit epsilon
LDALCRRFGISNDARVLHGALLDSEILAEVYLELIGGRQPGLVLSETSGTTTAVKTDDWRPTRRETPLPSRLSDSEKAAHAAFVEENLGAEALWAKT